MIEGQYIYRKEVDQSLLKEGFSIPISIQQNFHVAMNTYLKRGENKDIFIVVEGKTFKAKLINQKFDENKYPGHGDVLQVRYNQSSEIAKYFKQRFAASTSYIYKAKLYQLEIKKRIRIEEERREYLAIYTTTMENTFYVECITADEIDVAREWAVKHIETDIENFIYSSDPDARILEQSKLVKIRKLDRAIGNNLKIHYHYKCQVCGEDIGEKYDYHIAHIHHINPFSISLDNSSNNLMVICPNHHSIIHQAEPTFNFKNFTFTYRNGYKEKLLLNKHL
jgi:predicted restriction endonuclease